MASVPPAVQTGHCQSCHSSWTHSQAALGEGAGAKTPGHGQQRPTRLHTQHGSQWGREGRLLGAALQRRSPRPALLSSDPHTWTLQGPGHLEDVTQRRGPPSEAGCTPAGRGGPLLTQAPAPPLRPLSVTACHGQDHNTQKLTCCFYTCCLRTPREDPPHLHLPATPLLALAPTALHTPLRLPPGALLHIHLRRPPAHPSETRRLHCPLSTHRPGGHTIVHMALPGSYPFRTENKQSQREAHTTLQVTGKSVTGAHFSLWFCTGHATPGHSYMDRACREFCSARPPRDTCQSIPRWLGRQPGHAAAVRQPVTMLP